MSPPLGTMQEENMQAIPIEIHAKFWKIYSEQLFKD